MPLPLTLALALALAVAPATVPPNATGHTPARRAQSLLESARRRVASGSHEQRQFARRELEEAARLDPGRADVAIELGQLELEADLLRNAHQQAERALALDSTSAGAWSLAGRVWRRRWLLSSDATLRDRAIVCFSRSVRYEPAKAENWAQVAILLVDVGEIESAFEAAVQAARRAPADPRMQVLLAALAQRRGDVESADRIFRAAIPRLPAALRERFEDVTPLLPPWLVEGVEDLEPEARAKYAERFWAQSDPDPVSGLNEARLEFWTRVAQATALYGTSRPGEWDVRAQYYVRYGPPDAEVLNPIDKPERLHQGDWVAWYYPKLGMRLWMGTGSRYFGFGERISAWSTWALAAPDSLRRREELDPLNRGWAVFHRLPPGIERLDSRLSLAQFRSGDAARLLAHAEVTGGFEDRTTTEWVVRDSSLAVVVREAGPTAPSACRAGEARASSFTTPLAPGRYEVAVQVNDESGRRACSRRDVFVSPANDRLSLSDLVVTCSPPLHSISAGSGVRLEPDTGLFPEAGDQLHLYFEVYHLDLSPEGEGRFVYDCRVRPAETDRRGWLSRVLAPRDLGATIEMSRTESTRGDLRRQFFSVPVGSLPEGRYAVDVLVRDVRSGEQASALATFDRRK